MRCVKWWKSRRGCYLMATLELLRPPSCDTCIRLGLEGFGQNLQTLENVIDRTNDSSRI